MYSASISFICSSLSSWSLYTNEFILLSKCEICLSVCLIEDSKVKLVIILYNLLSFNTGLKKTEKR